MSGELEIIGCGGAASWAPSSGMIDTFDMVTAQLTADIQLLVMRHPVGPRYTASLVSGTWPHSERLSLHSFNDLSRSRVCQYEKPVLWLDSTCYDLPWLELLKIADFLVLPIPLPHPAEGTAVAP